MVRPVIRAIVRRDDMFGNQPLGFRLRRNNLNTAYPIDRANGALVGVKGIASALSGGVLARFGSLSVALDPVVAHHQNDKLQILDVVFADRSPFSYPWHRGRIDWPQRFGEEAFTVIDAGNSFIRGDFGPLGIGLSNESRWRGPTRRYPLLLGNAAPGFPHVFLGISRPVGVWLGHAEAQFLIGELRDSDHFNDDPFDD